MLQPFWDERRGYESRQRAREEALPLPLYVVAFFEQAVLQAPPIGAEHAQDVRLLTAFLLMLWGALRYSDLQRVLVSDLCCEDGVARAACWRIKRSASGMTFGDLTLGIIDNWTHRSQELIDFMKECDFLIAGPQRFRVPGFVFVRVGSSTALANSHCWSPCEHGCGICSAFVDDHAVELGLAA